MNDVRIVPAEEKYVAGFTEVLDSVARERRYVGFLEAPPVETMREFVKSIVGGAGVQLFAVTQDDTVVGWCDIVRNPREGFRHTGRLGMGLLPKYRRRGLGRQLVIKAVEAARAMGMERIELEVFASNAAAIELYQALGFVSEGIKRKARKLDGRYEDNIQMALIGDLPNEKR